MHSMIMGIIFVIGGFFGWLGALSLMAGKGLTGISLLLVCFVIIAIGSSAADRFE